MEYGGSHAAQGSIWKASLYQKPILPATANRAPGAVRFGLRATCRRFRFAVTSGERVGTVEVAVSDSLYATIAYTAGIKEPGWITAGPFRPSISAPEAGKIPPLNPSLSGPCHRV